MAESNLSIVDTVVSRLATNTRTTPDAPALVAECGTLSYAELNRNAAALASHLADLAVRPSGLIGICAERSFSQITGLLATWMAGCAYLPIDPSWPDQRIRSILDSAGCSALICDAANAHRIESTVPVVVLERDLAAIQAAEAKPRPAVKPNDLAYVIYTSGSTGTPKGVEITHANVVHLVDWHLAAFDVTAADRGTHAAGLAFDASVWEVWPYLCAGASVVLAPEKVRTSAPLLKRWLIDSRATIAFAPTALAEQIMTLDWSETSTLRILLTGGDRLLRNPAATLPFEFVNNYGPTECTVVATSGRVGSAQDDNTNFPPIGRAIAGAKIYILDPSGNRVPEGEIGEIYIGGNGVGRGYRHDPKQTEEKFLADPFVTGSRMYRTGDLGSIRPDGQIAFHGRADNQVKVRGNRIELEEIAQAALTLSAIAACTVVTHVDDRGATQLLAYVEFMQGRQLSATELRDGLSARLPDYMVPSQFVRMDQFPLTANGKIDKAALPRPNAQNALEEAAFAEPQSPIEMRLTEILAEIMDRKSIGLDDNFFLIGGHSLLGTQVVLRASESFGVELSLRHLFKAPTVRKLAVVIEGLIMEVIDRMSEDEAKQQSISAV